jgi:hypothetical protein
MSNLRDRLLGALMVAWAAAVFVGFLAGCVYAIALGLTENILSIGAVTAIVTAPIAGVVVFALGWPLFRTWMRRGYSSALAHIGAGALIAAVTTLLVAAAHYFGGFLLGKDFPFALATIIVAGPVAALVVWLVLRDSR